MQHKEYLLSRKKLKAKTVHSLKGQGMKGEIKEAAKASGNNTQSNAMFLLFPKLDAEQRGNKIKQLVTYSLNPYSAAGCCQLCKTRFAEG